MLTAWLHAVIRYDAFIQKKHLQLLDDLFGRQRQAVRELLYAACKPEHDTNKAQNTFARSLTNRPRNFNGCRTVKRHAKIGQIGRQNSTIERRLSDIILTLRDCDFRLNSKSVLVSSTKRSMI